MPRPGGDAPRPMAAVAVHAERLEDDAVWKAVVASLRGFERRGMRITFFVFPRAAEHRGLDLGPKLRRLADGGHEIAQHTHYYRRFDIDAQNKVQKEASLDQDNVLRCLERDFEYLGSRGFTPTGFVSGGWAIRGSIFRWLAERNFTYDCSFRNFTLAYDAPDAAAGHTTSGPFEQFGFLEVPTTHALRPPFRATGDGRYRLVYCHDYDLLKPSAALAWRTLPLLLRNPPPVPVRELAGALLKNG